MVSNSMTTPRPFTNGFLPEIDPVIAIPGLPSAWKEIGEQLSKLALNRYIRPAVAQLPPFPLEIITDERQAERAMSQFSYMANLYLFAPDHPPTNRLPPPLAVAWVAVALLVGRPPVLSYAAQTLFNWRRLNTNEPIEVGNLTLMQNFLGGMDEEWFVTIHTHIEAAAAPALRACLIAQQAVAADDSATLQAQLETIGDTLDTMRTILSRMPERCDPYVYYHRVRPYMFGWKDNPLMPGGLIYEGVAEFEGNPREFRGETGAQSSIIPALDALLGVQHELDEMRRYLVEMLDYMPPADRRFIQQLDAGPSVRQFIAARKDVDLPLRDAYNYSLSKLQAFRELHIEYAATYILKPANIKGDAAVGTGGTPFTVYLKKHIRETAAHLL